MLRRLHRALTTAAAPSSADRAWAACFSRRHIPQHALDISFARCSGPGGQNVNKLNTKSIVRFKISQAAWLPEWVRERLLATPGIGVTRAGWLRVTSERHRTQRANLDDCLDKIHALCVQAGRLPGVPDDATRERVALHIDSDKRRTLERKKHHASKKAARRKPMLD